MRLVEESQLNSLRQQPDIILVSSRPQRGSRFKKRKADRMREATGNRCEVCGKKGDTQIHHNVPRSWGGNGHVDNGYVLCPNCHKKADGLTFRRKILLSQILGLRRTNSPKVTRRSL